MVTFKYILWGLAIGISLGGIYYYYIRNVQGGFIRKLMELKAFDETSAVLLSDIGFSERKLIVFALREGSELRDTVSKSEDRYYIAQDRLEMAEKKYGGKSVKLSALILCVLGVCILMLVLSYAFPEIVEMLGDFID